MSSHTLDETIATCLGAENRLKTKDTNGNSQVENALFSKTMMRKKNANKSELECYCCKKIGHTVWNCKICANDLLKG